jgi:uncharacterized protein YPO0396
VRAFVRNVHPPSLGHAKRDQCVEMVTELGAIVTDVIDLIAACSLIPEKDEEQIEAGMEKVQKAKDALDEKNAKAKELSAKCKNLIEAL